VQVIACANKLIKDFEILELGNWETEFGAGSCRWVQFPNFPIPKFQNLALNLLLENRKILYLHPQ
jgi:hypothetical protein